MGLQELRAIMAGRTGLKPAEGTHAAIKPSGPKEKKPLRNKSLKKQREERAIVKAGGDPEDKELEDFFAAVEKEWAGNGQCWECGEFVPDKFLRHATAHIFPKGIFPSVASHPANYVILGASCCHDQSHRMDLFPKMKIWRETVDRFFLFEPSLTAIDRTKHWYTLFVKAANASFPQLFQERPDLWLL